MSRSIRKACVTLFIVALALLPGSCGTGDFGQPGSNSVQVGGVRISASFVPVEVDEPTLDIDTVKNPDCNDDGTTDDPEDFTKTNARFTVRVTPVSGDTLPEVYITKFFVEYIPRVSPDVNNQLFTPLALEGFNALRDELIGIAGTAETITEFDTILVTFTTKFYYANNTPDERRSGIYSIRVTLKGSTEFGREFTLPVEVETHWDDFDRC